MVIIFVLIPKKESQKTKKKRKQSKKEKKNKRIKSICLTSLSSHWPSLHSIPELQSGSSMSALLCLSPWALFPFCVHEHLLFPSQLSLPESCAYPLTGLLIASSTVSSSVETCTKYPQDLLAAIVNLSPCFPATLTYSRLCQNVLDMLTRNDF